MGEGFILTSENDSESRDVTRRYTHAAAVWDQTDTTSLPTKVVMYYYSFTRNFEVTLPNYATNNQITVYNIALYEKPTMYGPYGEPSIDHCLHLVIPAHTYGDIYVTRADETLELVKAGYLHKDWATAEYLNLNKSAITEIIFTTDSSLIPSGITKVSVGSPRVHGVYGENVYNGLTYDVEGYLSGTKVVLYCPYIIFAPTNSSYLFSDASGNYFTNLTSLQFNNVFITSITKNMEGMFKGCSRLTEIQTTQLITDQCENMKFMFSECRALQNLNLSSFNTNKVNTMSNMFSFCERVQAITFSSNFVTNLVTDMTAMFAFCSALQSLDLSSFDTTAVVSMNSMFKSCITINELNLVTFNLTYVQDTANMLYGSTNLQKITSPYVTKQSASVNIDLPIIDKTYIIKGKANLGAVTKITNINGIDSMSSYVDGVVTPTIIIIDYVGDCELAIYVTYKNGLNTNMSYGIITLSYFDEEVGYVKKYNVAIKSGTITIRGLKAAEFTITVTTTFKTLTTTESVTVVTGDTKKWVYFTIQKDNKGGIYNLTVV